MECFQNNRNVEKACNAWFKKLNSYFFECFSKIRCKTSYKSNNPVVDMMKQRSEIIQKIKKAENDQIDLLKTELKEIELKLTKLVAEENRKIVFKNFEHLSNTDGTTNNNGV